jgi:hypothetical protein
MEQSPSWEANQFSSILIPCILWKTEVHYCIFKSSLSVAFVSSTFNSAYQKYQKFENSDSFELIL